MSARRLAIVVALAAATPALAQTTIDTFDAGSNTGGWAFVPGFDTVPTTGGNPGAWLGSPVLDTFYPSVGSAPGTTSAFTGNLRAKGVSSIGIDGQTVSTDFDVNTFEFTILLRDANGTPGDITDDDFAYFVGPEIPLTGAGWKSFDFAIPSQDTSAVPAGWKGGFFGDFGNFRPGVSWNDVITNVDSVEFYWCNPELFAIFQQWTVGIDNARVTVPEPAIFGAVALVPALLRRRR